MLSILEGLHGFLLGPGIHPWDTECLLEVWASLNDKQSTALEDAIVS